MLQLIKFMVEFKLIVTVLQDKIVDLFVFTVQLVFKETPFAVEHLLDLDKVEVILLHLFRELFVLVGQLRIVLLQLLDVDLLPLDGFVRVA